MIVQLPKAFRPIGLYYRQCDLGVDLPSSFYYDIKGIDEDIFPVWHAYRVLWDSIINSEVGSLDDPRYVIQSRYGNLNFGHVLTNGRGCPSPDGNWHLWRWCYPHGVAHIINIDSKDPGYLSLLVKRLKLQADYNDRYGHRGYTKLLEQLDLEAKEKAQQDHQDMLGEIGKVNSSMMARARENFASGHTAPTNPQKDIIFSGAGVNKRGTLRVPVTEKDAGLITPEDW